MVIGLVLGVLALLTVGLVLELVAAATSARREFHADRVVADLRSLLSAAAEAGPFVLVGHSLGGHYNRLFTQAYPDDVLGVVLVDARHPALAERMEGYEAWIDEGTRTMEVGLTLSRFGVMRLLGDVFGTMDTLPDGVPGAMVATTMDPRHMRAHLDEVRHLPELDARVAASAEVIVVPDADQLSIVTDERHAQIVSDAIRDVVRLIRDERTGSADEPG